MDLRLGVEIAKMNHQPQSSSKSTKSFFLRDKNNSCQKIFSFILVHKTYILFLRNRAYSSGNYRIFTVRLAPTKIKVLIVPEVNLTSIKGIKETWHFFFKNFINNLLLIYPAQHPFSVVKYIFMTHFCLKQSSKK